MLSNLLCDVIVAIECGILTEINSMNRKSEKATYQTSEIVYASSHSYLLSISIPNERLSFFENVHKMTSKEHRDAISQRFYFFYFMILIRLFIGDVQRHLSSAIHSET